MAKENIISWFTIEHEFSMAWTYVICNVTPLVLDFGTSSADVTSDPVTSTTKRLCRYCVETCPTD